MLRWAWQLPVAFTLAALAIAALGLAPAAVPAVYLAAATPELVRIDLREHRLPNRIVVPGIVVGLAGGGAVMVGDRRRSLVAALASSGLLALLALGGGIGMGDVKLAALIGLASPTIAIALAAPLAAFLLGGAAASIVLVRGLLAGRGREARRRISRSARTSSWGTGCCSGRSYSGGCEARHRDPRRGGARSALAIGGARPCRRLERERALSPGEAMLRPDLAKYLSGWPWPDDIGVVASIEAGMSAPPGRAAHECVAGLRLGVGRHPGAHDRCGSAEARARHRPRSARRAHPAGARRPRRH